MAEATWQDDLEEMLRRLIVHEAEASSCASGGIDQDIGGALNRLGCIESTPALSVDFAAGKAKCPILLFADLAAFYFLQN